MSTKYIFKEVADELSKRSGKEVSSYFINETIRNFVADHTTKCERIDQEGKGQNPWGTTDLNILIAFKRYFGTRIKQKRKYVKKSVAKQEASINTQPTEAVSAKASTAELQKIIDNLRSLGYTVECQITPPAIEL